MKLTPFLLLASLTISAVSAAKVSLRGPKGAPADLSWPQISEGTSSRRLPSSSSEDGGKDKGKGKGKGKGSSDNPCDFCYNGKPTSLTFRYELPAANSLYQPEDKASCRASPDKPYPTSTTLSVSGSTPFPIEEGTVFTIDGAGFSAYTAFDIGGWGECDIHTSCSVPLIPGDKIGPFVLVGDDEGCASAATTGDCVVCDKENKNRPDSLTFTYSSAGKNSLFQDESKASCRADTYPSTTTITVETKSGEQSFTVSDGESFTVAGEFEAYSDFEISGWSGGSCNMHTSCSVPLTIGDQIGPFILTQGNGLTPESDCSVIATDTQVPDTVQGCVVCDKENKNRPDSLSFIYKSAGQNSLFQDESKASCRAGTYPSTTTLTIETKSGKQSFTVSDGESFTVEGEFDAYSEFEISGWSGGSCDMHTSCSVPLTIGDQIGPFVLTHGNGLTPDSDCEVPTAGDCVVCDKENKNKPDSLSFIYKSDGKNSLYQDESKASCRADTYPFATTLTIDTKSGEQIFTVMDGETFTIEGEFDAYSEFEISGWSGGSCNMHTSCSVPLTIGDQIGPFLLIEGNDCEFTPPTNPPTPGPTNPPTPGPTNPPTPGPTEPPTPGPTEPPTPGPTEPPTPRPTNPPTPGPTEPPTPGPTNPPTPGPTEPPTPGPTNPPTPGPTEPPTPGPTNPPTPGPTEPPTPGPTNPPTPGPTEPPTPGPTEPPTPSPTMLPTPSPTPLPTEPPTDLPTVSTVVPKCLVQNKDEYECGENIAISFDFANADTEEGMKGALVDDWVGIYPCGTDEFKHSESWLWACAEFGENFLSCSGPKSSGTLVFQDPMPAYNDLGPHEWPIAPFLTAGPGSEISSCFKAVLLRFDGPSVPPYVTSCVSSEFTINVGTTAECQVRPSSPAFDSSA